MTSIATAQISTDLLGDPVLERDARFVNNCRIELSRKWGEGPLACVIGHNGSLAGRTTDDPTVLWWIAWCRLFGFGGFIAVNLYPWVSPDPDFVYRKLERIAAGDVAAHAELHQLNLPTVVRIAKAADQVFACWGAIAKDAAWIDHVCGLIQSAPGPQPDLWCWGTNADGSPKHPMARGKHRIPRDQQPILWRAA